jgi:hypothetical protein
LVAGGEPGKAPKIAGIYGKVDPLMDVFLIHLSQIKIPSINPSHIGVYRKFMDSINF